MTTMHLTIVLALTIVAATRPSPDPGDRGDGGHARKGWRDVGFRPEVIRL